MIKELSAVSKRECSDSVFDWLSIFWSVTLECSAETRPESVHCFLVVVSELHHPCLPDPEKNQQKQMNVEFQHKLHLIDYCKVHKYCKVKFIITDTYCYY